MAAKHGEPARGRQSRDVAHGSRSDRSGLNARNWTRVQCSAKMATMTKRATRNEAIALLCAFYDLGRMSLAADLGVLAGRLGWGVGRVVRVLAHLEGRGLVDRERCRLTL